MQWRINDGIKHREQHFGVIELFEAGLEINLHRLFCNGVSRRTATTRLAGDDCNGEHGHYGHSRESGDKSQCVSVHKLLAGLTGIGSELVL